MDFKEFLRVATTNEKPKEPNFYTENPAEDLKTYNFRGHRILELNTQKHTYATILPFINNQGGVVSENGKFIAGHSPHINHQQKAPLHYLSTYEFDKKDVAEHDEEVVYLGLLPRHFGHLLLDGGVRWWWINKNPDYRGKYALCPTHTEKQNGLVMLKTYLWYLQCLGVKEEQIIIVDIRIEHLKIGI